MNETHLVMHGLAVKKNGTPEAIASLLGLDPNDVKTVINQLVEAKRAVEVQGKYLLTPPARMALDSDYSHHYADLRANQQFKAGYEAFERLNGALKQLITDWQTIGIGSERVPNDHSNKDYDRKIIDRLGQLHDRADVVLLQLASALPRMRLYSEKLARALENAEDGAVIWVSDPKIESYHTLWFELHEDLLRLMGRERKE